jgi:hypothetical protein
MSERSTSTPPPSLTYPPISRAAAAAMGREPLFVPDPQSPLFSANAGTSRNAPPTQTVPQQELDREMQAFEDQEMLVNRNVLAQALQESQSERDRVARMKARKSKKSTGDRKGKRKAPVNAEGNDVAGSDDDESTIFTAETLAKFAEEMK